MAPGLAGAFLCHSAHFVQCELITLASATREIRPKLGTQGAHTNRQGCPRPIPLVPSPEARVTTGFFRSSLKKGPPLVPVQRGEAPGGNCTPTPAAPPGKGQLGRGRALHLLATQLHLTMVWIDQRLWTMAGCGTHSTTPKKTFFR